MYKSIKRHLKIVSVLNLAKKYINIICPTIQDTTKMDCICNIKGHLNTNDYFPSDKNTIVSKNNVLPATTIYQKKFVVTYAKYLLCLILPTTMKI